MRSQGLDSRLRKLERGASEAVNYVLKWDSEVDEGDGDVIRLKWLGEE